MPLSCNLERMGSRRVSIGFRWVFGFVLLSFHLVFTWFSFGFQVSFHLVFSRRGGSPIDGMKRNLSVGGTPASLRRLGSVFGARGDCACRSAAQPIFTGSPFRACRTGDELPFFDTRCNRLEQPHAHLLNGSCAFLFVDAPRCSWAKTGYHGRRRILHCS